MGDSRAEHSDQGEQNSWFSTQKHEGLHKASERYHIQDQDPPNYGVWDPPLQTPVRALEQVQRRVAGYVCNDFISRTLSCVTKMLDGLKWEPLEVRSSPTV